MIDASFKVVLDANVLFPYALRDTLLRAAQRAWYQPYWSDAILAEMTTNLVAKGKVTEEKAMRLRAKMEEHFAEAMITGHEQYVEILENDPKDRHVVAVAVRAGAELIVTGNLRDFRPLPDGIEAKRPGAFLVDLLDLHPSSMIDLLRQQAESTRNPAHTFEQLLEGLSKTVPDFVAEVRRLGE